MTQDREPAEPGPDDGSEVLVFIDEFGVLVQGPTEAAAAAIDQLLVGEDTRRTAATRLPLSDVAAVGATGAALAASSGEYLRLTAESLAKIDKFGKQYDSSRALRGWVRDKQGFAGQLVFDEVSLAAEQALALQTAAVSLALRSAIANVQKAVERVEDKVDQVNRHLDSRLRGDVIGTYRHLEEVAQATNARGRLLQADWDSVAGVRNQLNRDLETLRAYVTRSAEAVTHDLSVPKRESRLRSFHSKPGDVADMLALILVAEQSLHLYEYLRLQQVRNSEAEFVSSAVSDAQASLRKQQELNQELVSGLRSALDRARAIEPLEIHHVLSKQGLDTEARVLDQRIREFASATRLTPLDRLASMTEPGLSDARDELRQRAVSAGRTARELGSSTAKVSADAAAKGARRVSKSVTSKMRRRSS